MPFAPALEAFFLPNLRGAFYAVVSGSKKPVPQNGFGDGLPNWQRGGTRPSSGEAAAARGDRAGLVGAQTNVLESPTPPDVGVTKAFDIDAARETSLDEPRSQEGKRECQVDLTHCASRSDSLSRSSVRE